MADAVETFERELGPDDLQSLSARTEWAQLLGQPMGRTARPRGCSTGVSETASRALGPRHEVTLSARLARSSGLRAGPSARRARAGARGGGDWPRRARRRGIGRGDGRRASSRCAETRGPRSRSRARTWTASSRPSAGSTPPPGSPWTRSGRRCSTRGDARGGADHGELLELRTRFLGEQNTQDDRHQGQGRACGYSRRGVRSCRGAPARGARDLRRGPRPPITRRACTRSTS